MDSIFFQFAIGFIVEAIVIFVSNKFKSDYRHQVTILILGSLVALFVGINAKPHGTCESWNLGSDFLTYPDQENPNRDSCGNLNVWYFFQNSSVDLNVSDYTLLKNFIPNAFGITGYQQWQGSYPWKNQPNVNFPYIGINTDNETIIVGTAMHPTKSIAVHPWEDKSPILIGWKSPVQGVVDISGFVRDLDTVGGDGILWLIKKENQELASGSILNMGQQPFLNGNGSENLRNVYVNKNEFIYFIIHPNENDLYDTTQIDIQINLQ